MENKAMKTLRYVFYYEIILKFSEDINIQSP